MTAFGAPFSLVREVLLAALLFPLAARAEGDAKWPISNAALRFQMEIETRPLDPSAGIIAILPNGGNLPAPFPEAVVLDSENKELKSEVIWHNPHEGLGLVFEAPKGQGPIWIYVRAGTGIKNPWTEKSEFHPGLLLYTHVTRGAGLPEARAIAAEVPPGKSARMGQVPMVADRANRFGSSDRFVSYYTGWLNVKTPGKYRFATISSDGSTALVDGQVVADWPGIHPYKPGEAGQHGTTVELTKGQHRVQYFHYNVGATPQAQFVWRYPGMDAKELAKTPTGNDWNESGSVRVISAESHNGAPVAIFEKSVFSYVGYNSEWIDLFELTAPFAEQLKDATYTWRFTGGLEAKGSRLLWLVPRTENPPTATLSVSSVRGASTFSRPLYPDVLPLSAKVSDKDDRATYQEALRNRLKGARGSHLTESWSPGIWGLLPEMIEPKEGREILAQLYTGALDDLAKLPADAREKLDNIYYEELWADKQAGLAFIKDIIDRDRDPIRHSKWQYRLVDFLLNEIGDIKAARTAASQISLNLLLATPEAGALKMVQLGDIERLDGNLEKAQQIYAEAQALYIKATAQQGGQKLGTAPDRPGSSPKPQETPGKSKGFVIAAALNTSADWRKRTVQETAYFTEVKNLLQQGYLTEARANLDKWQAEFPLGKLAGDFPVAEASYFATLENYERAVRILKTYRKQVDISKDLPEAMQLEWNCLAALQQLEPLKELAADVKKRFPDLPLAQDADDVLAGHLPPKVDVNAIMPQKITPRHKKKSQ